MKFSKIFFLVTIPYALLMSLFRIVTGNFGVPELIGVAIGSLLFGTMFTIFILLFTRWQMKKITIAVDPGETLVKEAGANRILSGEGVGGKLALTDKRLVFKSHKLNIQVHQFSVPLNEIQSVAAGKTGGFLKNVLMVCLNDGSRNKFIVFEPDEWVSAINYRATNTSA